MRKFVLSMIMGWITIHLILFMNVNSNPCGYKRPEIHFWPIDEGTLSCIYDKSEFMTYIITPVVVYIVYILLDSKKPLNKGF